MAYDLFGNQPTNEHGKHFRMAVIAWPLLADVILKFAPDECSPCKEWRGPNCYGRGLDAVQSLRLAEKLEQLAGEGTILAAISEFQEETNDGDLWLSQGDLYDFVTFLKSCGGFYIS